MLTIKKRFPHNRLYIGGALAFIGGYSLFMIGAAHIPVRVATVATNYTAQEAPADSQNNPTSEPETQTPVWTPAPMTNGSAVTQPSSSQPIVETPAPTDTTPTVPIIPEAPTIPELPIDLPVDPAPEPEPEQQPTDNDGGLLNSLVNTVDSILQ